METNQTEIVTTETVETVTPNESEVDEDYKWLTERLDAHTKELMETRLFMQTQMEAFREANQNSLTESKTLIESLTQMVTTMSQTLTALAASALLKSETLTNTSEAEPEAEQSQETVIVENPESVEVESPAAKTLPEKPKRKRL